MTSHPSSMVKIIPAFTVTEEVTTCGLSAANQVSFEEIAPLWFVCEKAIK